MALNNFLILSAFLFCTGIYGVLSRKNAVLVLMSIELMLAAVNINLLAFGVYNVLAFSVVVLGGLGSIPGAFIGGLVFGLVNEFGGTYLLSQRDVIIFAILILVLVVKPTGLLGREGYT